eukprot:7201462-Alexandrium_andersonii.AAC.1
MLLKNASSGLKGAKCAAVRVLFSKWPSPTNTHPPLRAHACKPSIRRPSRVDGSNASRRFGDRSIVGK